MKKIGIVLCAAFAGGLAAGQSGSSDFVVSPLRQPADQLSKMFPPDVIATTSDGKISYNSRRLCVYPSGDRKTLSVKPCEKPARKLRLLPLRFLTPPAKR